MLTRTMLTIATLATLAAPALAEPVEYAMDPQHTHIGLTWNHLGFSETRARFDLFEGRLILDEEDPTRSRVEVTIPIDSLNTNVARLDEELFGPEFFDLATFANARFTSTEVVMTGEATADVHGDLSIRGITRPVVLAVRLNRLADHPMSGKRAAGFTAEAVIRRSDFGITKFVPMVSDEVRLFISTEAAVDD